MQHWVRRILAVALLVPAMAMVALEQASAGECRTESVATQGADGVVTYQQVQVDCAPGTTPGNSNGGGNQAPACSLTSPATFCWGSTPCYYKDVVTPYAPPQSTPPTPDADWQVRMCLSGAAWLGNALYTGTAVWIGAAPEPPPLIDRAYEAFGRLAAPAATLAFNPTTRTLVNLDTWFWAQGLDARELRGTSAFGLVAIATPDRLEITPGDGSARFSCAWVTAKSDQCSYPYLRSSLGGSTVGPSGSPAFQAAGQARWTVRFEDNGVPTPVPGAPTEFSGPTMNTPVEVAEVQTLVTVSG